jgi:hypothetical protein
MYNTILCHYLLSTHSLSFSLNNSTVASWSLEWLRRQQERERLTEGRRYVDLC